MFKKMPIRLRLTAMMVILLSICCVGLTVILNFSADIMATKIDAVALSPALNPDNNDTIFDNVQVPSSPAMMPTQSIEAQQARTEFQL